MPDEERAPMIISDIIKLILFDTKKKNQQILSISVSDMICGEKGAESCE